MTVCGVSAARWILVLQPPRERPSAWSSGSPGTGRWPAPAAAWWARTVVESTLMSQVSRPWASRKVWIALTIMGQMPCRCQVRNSQ
jgi:hypothetical protein